MQRTCDPPGAPLLNLHQITHHVYAISSPVPPYLFQLCQRPPPLPRVAAKVVYAETMSSTYHTGFAMGCVLALSRDMVSHFCAVLHHRGTCVFQLLSPDKCTRRPPPGCGMGYYAYEACSHTMRQHLRLMVCLVNTSPPWVGIPGTSHSSSSSSLFGSYVLRPIPSNDALRSLWSHPRPNVTDRLSLPGVSPSPDPAGTPLRLFS
ncbi:hypothetical protein BGW80DRAFT_844741 [Lactifluus volemus]|nr:hypothetical protein BGW80DRAFT_844741 [Lactifluus volemus]